MTSDTKVLSLLVL